MMTAKKMTKRKTAKSVSTAADTGAIITMIERAALNPDVDIEKMERLLAVQERVFNKQAEMDYSKAMSSVQSQVQVVAADLHNSQTNSDYASLSAINKKITPIYTKEGFAMSFGEEESPHDHHIRVICDCMHSSGHAKRYHYDSPIDDKGIKGTVNKTAQHARGSAIMYGRRYLTAMIFNISTGYDDDGNASTGQVEYIDDKQVSELRQTIENVGQDPDAVSKWLKTKGIDSFNMIPANLFPKIIVAIKRSSEKQS